MMENIRSKPLPDILAPGLRVLFIGYNPGLRSAELGHHYAGLQRVGASNPGDEDIILFPIIVRDNRVTEGNTMY